eukprot:CAMPEP_0119122916 /NCGR_PEP_ID=MMETSP1310-20130426/3026_1 /TAXON_ID=464262 /ORGANISM="Genus nov. species nov., Strain RCC2339" /LENGTH=214 /DNA_ID=CAMNT_0007112645 /DNA_START=117 /DNA_END=757 /DNA_ORIENTATION=+
MAEVEIGLDEGGFMPGLLASFAMIMATEIGDRTFFIAAIMAMRHSRMVVWSGAILALVVMTLLGCIFGVAAVAFLPQWTVNYAVIVMMFYFGYSMVKEGLSLLSSTEQFEELEEVKEDLSEKDDDPLGDIENDIKGTKKATPWRKVIMESFTLTFLAEWGDRSQVATIALSAIHPALAVVIGAMIGHSICTGFAVIGGRFLASYISESFIHISG